MPAAPAASPNLHDRIARSAAAVPAASKAVAFGERLAEVVPGADVGGDRLPIEVSRHVLQQKASPLPVGASYLIPWLEVGLGPNGIADSPFRKEMPTAGRVTAGSQPGHRIADPGGSGRTRKDTMEPAISSGGHWRSRRDTKEAVCHCD